MRECTSGLSTLLNAMPDPIVVVDSKGNILAINDRMEAKIGYEREKLLGTSVLEVKNVTAETKNALAENLAKRMKGLHVAPYEIEISRKDGEKLPFEVNAKRIKYANKAASLVVLRDITERRKAEEALRKSEEKYRMVAENALQGIVITRHRILYANGAFTKILGYTAEELLSLSPEEVKDMVHPQDRGLVWSRFRDRLAGKPAPQRYECRGIRKDGTVVWLEMFAHRILYDGKPAVHAAVIDITDRRKAEKSLRKSEEKFRNIFENANDCIVSLDRGGKILDVNRKTREVFGGSKEEVVGKHFSDITELATEDMPRLLNAFTRSLAGGSQTLNVQVSGQNGQEVILECSTSLAKVDDEVTVMAVARDITERKKMEEQLKQYSENLEDLVRKKTEELVESENRYSVLIEEAIDGVAMAQDGKVVLVNKRAAEMVGHPVDEMVGVPFERFLDEGSREQIRRIHTRRLRGEKVPSTYEMRMKSKTGEITPVEVSVKLVEYKGRPAVFVIVRDIAERRQKEKERLRLERLAAIGELAMMVGHDLRNPLQSIRNATYCLTKDCKLPQRTSACMHAACPPSHAQALEMLRIINKSVDYADKIVRDLQDYSILRRPLVETTDVNILLKDVLSQVSVPENVKFTTDLAPLPQIEIDRDMMQRVFLNLVANGVHAIENGGTLEISTRKNMRSIEVSFKDTGVGIPKRNMTQIFEPFFTTKAKGLGMGLPICKKFVESHGGSIEVESEEDNGSTFTVRLPIQEQR